MRIRAQSPNKVGTQQEESLTTSGKNTHQLVKNFLTALNTNFLNSEKTSESMSQTGTSRHSNSNCNFLSWEENKHPNYD